MRYVIRPGHILAFGFTFLLAVSCGNDIKEVRETAAKYEPSKETGKGITMLYTQNGQLKVMLKSPAIVRYNIEDPYIEFPQGLNLEFYNSNREVESTLDAKYGIRYEKQEKTIFRDSVIVVNAKDEVLITDELIWDEKKEKIFSDKNVKFKRTDETLYGSGFEANQDFTNYKIFNPVGETYVDPGENDEDF